MDWLGLWPDTCSGGIPGDGNSGCDASRNFDNVGEIIKELDSELYDQLDTYWPSYKGKYYFKRSNFYSILFFSN